MSIESSPLHSPLSPSRREQMLFVLLPVIAILLCGLLLAWRLTMADLQADAQRSVVASDLFFDQIGQEIKAAFTQPQALCLALRSRGRLASTSHPLVVQWRASDAHFSRLCPTAPGNLKGSGSRSAAPAAESPLRLEIRRWAGEEAALLIEAVRDDGLRLQARIDRRALQHHLHGRLGSTEFDQWLRVPGTDAMPLREATASRPALSHLLEAQAASSVHSYAIASSLPNTALIRRTLIALAAIGALALAVGLAGYWQLKRHWQRRHSPGAQLHRALERQEFEAFLQPMIELSTGECVGAEMLMRWHHPIHGLLAPGQFLRAARENGQLWPMTEDCFARLAPRLDDCEHLPDGFMLCVNVGASELSAPGDSERFASLARPGGRRWYTVIELPERDAHQPELAPRLAALQDRGFLIALDDFGSAHGGTRWLERLAVDLVKIDPGIVATIGSDSVTRPVLDAIVALARDTGVKLIAKGVERPQQTSLLRQLSVSYAQGYVFSAPMPVGEFIERWLAPRESDDDPSAMRKPERTDSAQGAWLPVSGVRVGPVADATASPIDAGVSAPNKTGGSAGIAWPRPTGSKDHLPPI